MDRQRREKGGKLLGKNRKKRKSRENWGNGEQYWGKTESKGNESGRRDSEIEDADSSFRGFEGLSGSCFDGIGGC